MRDVVLPAINNKLKLKKRRFDNKPPGQTQRAVMYMLARGKRGRKLPWNCPIKGVKRVVVRYSVTRTRTRVFCTST